MFFSLVFVVSSEVCFVRDGGGPAHAAVANDGESFLPWWTSSQRRETMPEHMGCTIEHTIRRGEETNQDGQLRVHLPIVQTK